jgi:N-acetylglucosaminyldiphosphoundecaprenol N-acetyl-beta-D-mannosaminyltransferase
MLPDSRWFDLLGVPVFGGSFHEALSLIEGAVSRNEKMHVITLNPEIMAHGLLDSSFYHILLSGELVVPDGKGIILASRFLGKKPTERIAGIELLRALLARGVERGWTFYFLGSKEAVVRKAVERARMDFPGVQIVGFHHGFFDDDQRVVADVNRLNPDFLFVGLGSPRQERWIYRYRSELKSRVMVGVGGSFDVLSGFKERAPQWMIRWGMEWLYRLVREPRRMKRVVPAFWRFGVAVLRQKFRKSNHKV